MSSNIENFSLPLIPREETAARRIAERKRQRTTRAIRRTLGAAGVIAVSWVGAHYYNKSNHIKSADTLSAIKAEVGHIPAGIKAINNTEQPGIKEVKYVVQRDPADVLVSSVAADIHPIAPNQDPQDEFSAIETYTDGSSSLYPGEILTMRVDTDSGVIMPNPTYSAEADG